MRLSIIIPTLNEAGYLPAAVAQAQLQAVLGPPHEIIVADCGSEDGTADLAVHLGTFLVQGQPAPSSRAAALNQGAAKATGDVLLFLDADTLVPRGYDRAIWQALRDPHVIGGAFEFALDGPFVKEFNITGRPMKGWVLVESEGVKDDEQLKNWIGRATKFVGKLPEK